MNYKRFTHFTSQLVAVELCQHYLIRYQSAIEYFLPYLDPGHEFDFSRASHIITQSTILYKPQKKNRAMRKQLVLIIPILAAMMGMIAIVDLNSANAQTRITPESNITSMSNSTMGEDMTGNMTNSSSPMMTNGS